MQTQTTALLFGFALLASVARGNEPVQQKTEPTYLNRPLSFWVSELGQPGIQLEYLPINEESFDFLGASVRLEGEDPWPAGYPPKLALETIGTNAIPFLLGWICDERVVLPIDEERERMRRLLADGSVAAFQILGMKAKSAIPELARLATNQFDPGFPLDEFAPVTANPIRALGHLGPEAIPPLSSIVTNRVFGTARNHAVRAIAGMGTNAVTAIPALLNCLGEENHVLVGDVIRGLGKIGYNQQSVLNALTSVLRDRPQLRREALLALGACGHRAAPILLSWLDHEEDEVRSTAFQMFVATAPEQLTNIVALSIFAKALQSSDPDLQMYGAFALRAAGYMARTGRPRFDVPGGDLHRIRQEATNVLQQLAPVLLLPKNE